MVVYSKWCSKCFDTVDALGGSHAIGHTVSVSEEVRGCAVHEALSHQLEGIRDRGSGMATCSHAVLSRTHYSRSTTIPRGVIIVSTVPQL